MTIQRDLYEAVRHVASKPGLRTIHLFLRKLRGEDVKHLHLESLRDRFSAIYRNRVWLNGRVDGSLSGLGSELAHTQAIREALPKTLEALSTQLLLDIGCGDFTWMKELNINCQYIGLDVVAEVVASNLAKHGSERRSFIQLDATQDAIPSADTVLCREVLFHLSFRDIGRLVENVRRSSARYFIATTDPSIGINADIESGDFRRLNLQKAPFRFPSPQIAIADNALVSDRVLAVWPIERLPPFPK